jgi:hypothetical protein
MIIPPRQIGWGDKTKLLWNISKQLERITCLVSNCRTVTTTTTLMSCDCNSILTVGTEPLSGAIGYNSAGGDLFGSITPNCQNIASFIWYIDSELNSLLILVLYSSSCQSIIVEINSIEYTLSYNEDNGAYILGNIDNPFPALGETCSVKICNSQCTTTTTTTL